MQCKFDGVKEVSEEEDVEEGPKNLINVFEVFLPQLLLYPNPSDPLNGEAAALLMREPEHYNNKVREYCEKYAKAEDAGAKQNDMSESDVSEEYLSSDDDGLEP
ncbi:hypothetical protein CBR_g6306 [Chara braunii]|uniref:UBC core domain-containing protein n=1 Tax=Chara braunii TaxID=69332 RepID=A0A388KJD7_CHABU|nr:hypothetical protein CBR_g6306 [Chara braunii]|eukprot:GBG70175.1 hypothetical protein CBR_g6306 [Chara braunii]